MAPFALPACHGRVEPALTGSEPTGCSDLSLTTIDAQFSARHEGRVIRGKEQDGCSDLINGATTMHGNLGVHLFGSIDVIAFAGLATLAETEGNDC